MKKKNVLDQALKDYRKVINALLEEEPKARVDHEVNLIAESDKAGKLYFSGSDDPVTNIFYPVFCAEEIEEKAKEIKHLYQEEWYSNYLERFGELIYKDQYASENMVPKKGDRTFNFKLEDKKDDLEYPED